MPGHIHCEMIGNLRFHKARGGVSTLSLRWCSSTRVVVSGEGADGLFAGYIGYRFDSFRASNGAYTQWRAGGG